MGRYFKSELQPFGLETGAERCNLPKGLNLSDLISTWKHGVRIFVITSLNLRNSVFNPSEHSPSLFKMAWCQPGDPQCQAFTNEVNIYFLMSQGFTFCSAVHDTLVKICRVKLLYENLTSSPARVSHSLCPFPTVLASLSPPCSPPSLPPSLPLSWSLLLSFSPPTKRSSHSATLERHSVLLKRERGTQSTMHC